MASKVEEFCIIGIMTLIQFKEKLKNNPAEISFQETIALIDSLYDFTPVSFRNGDVVNDENQNNGSCKLFSFAKLNDFTKEETLACFGDYYRVDVLQNPDGADHQNIRNFMKTGWEGIQFFGDSLSLKSL